MIHFTAFLSTQPVVSCLTPPILNIGGGGGGLHPGQCGEPG